MQSPTMLFQDTVTGAVKTIGLTSGTFDDVDADYGSYSGDPIDV